MVLRPPGRGRVGRRRTTIDNGPPASLVARSAFCWPASLPAVSHQPLVSRCAPVVVHRSRWSGPLSPGTGAGSAGLSALRATLVDEGACDDRAWSRARHQLGPADRHGVAAPERRELPSGDELATCRIVVPRDRVRLRADGRRGPSVDVVDCAAWSSRPRRSIGGWEAGDLVEIHGALRRRFFRAGGQSVSRVEVEVRSARRVRRAATE